MPLLRPSLLHSLASLGPFHSFPPHFSILLSSLKKDQRNHFLVRFHRGIDEDSAEHR